MKVAEQNLAEKVKPLIQYKVTATVYNPKKNQTDGDPCTGANNTNICKMNAEGTQTIAVAKGMLKDFPKGSTVLVESNNPKYNFCAKVEDVFNARYDNQKKIDVYVANEKDNQSYTKGGNVAIISNKTENCITN